MGDSHDTLVVGAGISGLAYAHGRGSAASLAVLEAEPRAGGLVRSARLGEGGRFRCELGPEALRFEKTGDLTELLGELGLQAHEPPPDAKRRFLVCRRRLVEAPLGPTKLLRTPLFSWKGKLRLLSEPLRSPRQALDGSVADFVRHRIGPEALAALLDPLVSGIHAGDPEQLSMRACFPRLVDLVEKHGGLFRALAATRGDPAPSVMKPSGGCQALTDALAERLGGRLATGVRVEALERSASLWRVHASDGVHSARRLVLALPASAAAALLAPVAGELARTIASIPAESLVSYVHVWRREQVEHSLAGFGYLVASREGLRHLGTLFSSRIAPDSAPEGYVVLRTLLGGARAPELCEASAATIEGIVREEVGGLLGLSGEPECSLLQRWPRTLPRFDLEHPRRLAEIEHRTPPGLSLLGNWLHGIGVNHLVSSARALAREHSAA